MKYINEGLREIKGSLELGNLYEVIEAVTGVDYSLVNTMNIIPFSRVLYGTHDLVAQIDVLEGSTGTHRWTLQYTNADDFVLQRDGVFAGIYTPNTWIEKEEFRTKLFPNSYEAGDSWEFYTYAYGQSVHLEEVAVIRLENENFRLQVIGGFEWLDLTGKRRR